MNLSNNISSINGSIGNINNQINSLYTNNLLWSGASYVDAYNHYLNQTISSQKHGVVLIFSFYENNVAQNWGWHSFYVPKFMATNHGGQANCFNMMWNSIDTIKIIYFDDNLIVGNTQNSSGNNTRFVLRYVIGV